MAEWPDKSRLCTLMELRELRNLDEFGGIDGLLEKLHTGPAGISDATLLTEQRHEYYGKNEMAKPKTKSFLRLWFEAFLDTTLIILLVLAIISLIIALAVEHGENLSWLDGTAILVTVIVVTLVSSINTWSQERQFQKLNERQKDRTILVTRNGQPTQISIFDLMVGDIVTILTGDVIAADGLCIESNNIQCDEAPMTGESDLIRKSPEKMPFMLCGCKVQTGTGHMLCVAVGMNTQFGILKQAIITSTQERQETPLQEKLNGLAKSIGYVGFVAAGFTLLLLIIFWIIPAAKDTARFKQGEYWMLLLDYFIIAITIIVMAVPEGLPLAVTIALAYSMKKMLKDNNLVRVLSACETMGGATTICSDKTGTLTQNKMKVVAGFFDGDFLEGLQQTRDREVKQTYDTQNPAGDEPQSVPMEQAQPAMHSDTRISAEFLALITEAISMNSSADLKVLEDGRVDYLGNVTECAMLLFAKEQGVSYKEVRLQNKIAQTFPFSSEKKRMSVIIEKGKDDKDFYHIYTKGASEIVSGLCSRMHQKGKVVQITPDLRQSIDSIILKMASKGLRTIAIAHNSLPKSAAKDKNQQKSSDNDADDQGIFGENPPQDDLILIGIVGIKDPLREEVPFAINDCHDAHIVVRMVTGDNIITAMHIAEECGIYDPAKGIAMEGPVFRALPPEDQLRVLPKLQVLARSSPIDKHTLVSGLQQLGHVVAVTGDGTNDAPALSKADVGFAMGITGTEVAKDAAAIIITDDNFASIVKAVMWGRNVYDSIRKFIQFQLTVNVAAIIIAVIGAIFAITPLRAVQMLWVNLIMDTLAALALATETPTKKLLQRSPYGKGDSIICPSMWRNIIASAIYEIIVLIILLFMWGPKADWSDPSNININTGCSLLTSRDEIVASELMFPNGLCRSYLFDSSTAVFSERHFSLIFNTFIFTQMFNWIASRKCYNELNFFDRIFESLMFVFIWIIVAVLQVIIMLVPGIRDAFTIIPISGQMWGVSLAFSIMILPYRFLISLLLKVPDPFHGEVTIQEDAGAPSGVYKMDTPPPEGCNLKLPPIDKANSAAPAPLPPHQPSFSILGDQALPTEKGPVVDADGKEVNEKYVRFRQAGKSAHTVMAWKRPLELGKSKIIEEKYLPKYGSNVWQQKNQQHRASMANLQPGGGVPKKSQDGRSSSPMGVSTTSQQQTTGQKLSETSGQIETPRAQAASEENETS